MKQQNLIKLLLLDLQYTSCRNPLINKSCIHL